jgi:putative oxidoreductase
VQPCCRAAQTAFLNNDKERAELRKHPQKGDAEGASPQHLFGIIQRFSCQLLVIPKTKHLMKPLLPILNTGNSIQPFLLRLILGLVFFPHGAQKVLGWFGGYGFSGTMGFFTTQMHIPAIFAFLAIAAEFAGSLGLILGLFTRVAAFGIAVNMAVAVATIHWHNGFFMNWAGNQKGEGFEYQLLALGIAVALIISGGGRWSADRAIANQIDTNEESLLVSA